MSGHRCHAIDCTVVVPPRMLLCRRHWAMVPAELRAPVERHYRRGQCDDRRPSAAWVAAAARARAHVARVEGKERAAAYLDGVADVAEARS